jgi:hypothetical protein
MLRRLRPHSPTDVALAGAGLTVTVYAAATSAYLASAQPIITDLRVFAYPLVWLTVSVAAALWVDRTLDHRPRPWVGRAVGVAYVLGLAWLSGVVDASMGAEPLRLLAAVPGWGPIILLDNGLVNLSIVPFKLVTYLALGHIVAVLVAATGGSARAAALGMASCVSCTAPLLLAVGGLLGGTQATSLVASMGYDIATVALVVTFGLLVRAASRTNRRDG